MISETCTELGIEAVTLYCLSSENWKRPKREIDFLMNLLREFLVDGLAVAPVPVTLPDGGSPAPGVLNHLDADQWAAFEEEFLAEDEQLEVTPEAFRLRKRVLEAAETSTSPER